MHFSEQVRIAGKSLLAKDEFGQPMLTLLTTHQTRKTNNEQTRYTNKKYKQQAPTICYQPSCHYSADV